MLFSQLLNFRFKYKLLLFLQQFKQPVFFKYSEINLLKKHVFIFLAADYGNLGDVAITYAQTEFLKKNLPDYQVIEIPISKSLEGLHFVKKHIKKSDIVTTVGGGNLGDRYDQIEYIRQLVVQFFPDNKIISFPQTFDFSETPLGKKKLKNASLIYNNHSNLVFVARERMSYQLMQKHFNKVKLILTPDIVLTHDQTEPLLERNGVVLCMRNDIEKKLTESESKLLQSKVSEIFGGFTFYDTLIKGNELMISERMEELHKIWDIFRKSKLVITDRLHGMIFCYITNTPCLVFLNNNHKIEETYQWIKKNRNITLMGFMDENNIENYLSETNFVENEYQSLTSNFEALIKILNA